MIILFLHGWQSVPGGVKPTFLSHHGHTVINPKLPDEDFAEAVRIAQDEFDQHQPEVVVESRRGRCNQHRQRRSEVSFTLPGLEEVGSGQVRESQHRDPPQPD